MPRVFVRQIDTDTYKWVDSVLVFPCFRAVQTRSPKGLASVFEMGTGVSPSFWPSTN